MARELVSGLRLLALAAALAAALPSAFSDEGKKAEPPKGEKAPAPLAKGPQIEWSTSFGDAVQEASERNVPIYLHSHGST